MSIELIFSGRTHKENESINDCQDYFQVNLENNCFAIADGASQSFYPSIWAELLVNHFCKNPDINQNNWQDWLQAIQGKWSQDVKQRVTKAKSDNSPVWITNGNLLNALVAATSTFIGLQFIGDQVKGSIVGDSCLFIVEGDQLSKKYQLIQTYLLNKSTDFNDSPGYFASYNKDNKFIPHDFKILLSHKKSPKNIYFILATDALSKYIFKCTENQDNIFETLLSISSQETFEGFVESARNSDNIKMNNDDVTLLILSIPHRSIDQSFLQPRHEIQGNTKVHPASSNEQSDEENKSSSQSRDEVEENTEASPSSSNIQSGKETENISDFIFDIFHFLKSDLKSLNLTQKNNSKVPLSRDELVPTIEELQKQNTRLRYQRFGLGLGLVICLFIISLLLGTLINGKKENITSPKQLANTNSNQAKTKVTPVSTEKPKLTLITGISIYKDKELTQVLVDSVSNQYTVPIAEEVDNFIKFKMPIYIYQDAIIRSCNDCKSDEVETITPDTRTVINLRSSPNGIIFAQLKDKSR
ncbi:MAG: hypothetical protein ACKPFA_09840, partial [Dolichospermum sp.]